MNSVDQSLKRFAFWSKFVGYVTIVSGVLSALGGLFPYLLPAIYGVLTIFLGIFLVRSGKKADELRLTMSDESLTGMVENLAKYFKWQGILMIACTVLASIAFMFFAFGAIAFSGSF